jgi:uncharacterized protein (DUF2235 family)
VSANIRSEDPKTLMVFMDGTWQTSDQEVPTNIEKLHKQIKRKHLGRNQLTKHIDGVGSGGWADKIFGGAFGSGLTERIVSAYIFLADNYSPGDRIVLCGYSRGSFSARSLAGMINKVGLVSWKKCAARSGQDEDVLRRSKKGRKKIARRAFLLYKDDKETSEVLRDRGVDVPDSFSPSHPYARALRKEYSFTDSEGNVSSQIDMLCCFETVGMLGIPEFALGKLASRHNEKYDFHDTELGKIIGNAYHAVAIDERRASFPLTPMVASTDHNTTNLQQWWFTGAHGIGGGANTDKDGNDLRTGLADIAGHWMAERLLAGGVGLKEGWAKTFDRDPLAQPNNVFFHNLKMGPDTPRKINKTARVHQSVFVRQSEVKSYKPTNLQDAIAAQALSDA